MGADPRPSGYERGRAVELGVRLLRTIAVFVGALGASGGRAAEVPAPYARAIDVVDTLYLEPETVTAEAMLHASGRHLAERVDWLRVRPEPGGLRLLHGADQEIGHAVVTSWDDLPVALYAVETALVASGHPLPDLNPRYATIDGAATALDRFSRVLVGDGLDRFDSRLKGTLVGIGARLRIVDDALTVVGLFDGGPAAAAGLRDGDRLVRIDGVSTFAMPVAEAVRRIRGEVGSRVTLDIERPRVDDTGHPLAPQVLTRALARAEVIVPNVVHEVLAGDVGYVRIDHVSQKTVHNLRDALAALRGANALSRGLVLDLRGNSGGSMKESAAVVDLFVDEGLLLTTAGRDGRPVPNLLDRIEGHRTGDEVQLPIVVLVDARTASGAEIIAGALQEHGRAALLGQRTYGKGKVQKVYDLDAAARLKLTVAEYVLANDRRVGGDGLAPDVVLGRVYVDDDGLRLGAGWDLARERVAWHDVLPIVSIAEAPTEEAEPVEPEIDVDEPTADVTRELARRAVLTATDRSRDAVARALRHVGSDLAREEQARLAGALEARGLDWSEAAGPGARPEGVVRVTIVPTDDPEVVRISAYVENHGPTALRRAFVRLSSAFEPWDDRVVPLGHVPSGATVTREITVRLPPGLPNRDDLAEVELHADRRPALPAGRVTLRAPATEAARVAVEAHLVGSGPQRGVRIKVRNLGGRTLTELEAELAWPYDVDVELLTRGVRTSELPPAAEATFDLALRVGPTAPPRIPLRLTLDVARHGRVAAWELQLPLDGSPIVLQPPEVVLTPPRLSAPPGPMPVPIVARDDDRITSLVVFHNGDKVLWDPGGGPEVAAAPTVELVPGTNVLTVRAVDDDGVAVRRTWTILGIADEGVTAAEAPDPNAG